MKHLISTSLLIAAHIISITTSTSLTCVFDSAAHTHLPTILDYTCLIEQPLEISSEDISEFHIGALHKNISRNNNDVDGFFMMSISFKKIPSGLEKFPNLVYFSIVDCELPVISQNDLKDFKNLRFLTLSYNKIEIIEKNLLKFNPKLEEIYFDNNQIYYIDQKVFNGLSEIRVIDLRAQQGDNKIEINKTNAVDVIAKVNNLVYKNPLLVNNGEDESENESDENEKKLPETSTISNQTFENLSENPNQDDKDNDESNYDDFYDDDEEESSTVSHPDDKIEYSSKVNITERSSDDSTNHDIESSEEDDHVFDIYGDKVEDLTEKVLLTTTKSTERTKSSIVDFESSTTVVQDSFIIAETPESAKIVSNTTEDSSTATEDSTIVSEDTKTYVKNTETYIQSSQDEKNQKILPVLSSKDQDLDSQTASTVAANNQTINDTFHPHHHSRVHDLKKQLKKEENEVFTLHTIVYVLIGVIVLLIIATVVFMILYCHEKRSIRKYDIGRLEKAAYGNPDRVSIHDNFVY